MDCKHQPGAGWRNGHHCHCPGTRVERFVQPCLLLLLHENVSHGYELMDRLAEFGFDHEPIDVGAVYRVLRKMEEEGWVESSWDTTGAGPARRCYRLTAEGVELLHAWAANVEHSRRRLEHFLNRYRQTFPQRTS
ncbi:MAG: helix-turn-helix transcriptional regulator [Bacillota bacterium]